MVAIGFEVFANDKASAVLKHIGSSVEDAGKKSRLAGAAMKAGFAVGSVAIGGLAAILKTGFGEVKDFSAGQAQLVAGIKSTGNAAHVTVDGMEALAGSIQNMSGQTDDSIVAAEQLLLTFTNIKNTKTDKIFDQATLAAANMAAKMGGDAASKAVLLGKALNDPVKGITALTRVGVSFADGQRKQIAQMVKTGDTVGAQKVILAELSKEFGGAAKAAGQSLPGQMARAKRSFEDTSQALVTDLLPVINSLMSVVTNVVLPGIQKLTKVWMDHKLAVGIVAGAIGLAVVAAWAWNVAAGVYAVVTGTATASTLLQTIALGALKVAQATATAAQWLFNAALTANPIGLVVVAIVALTAAVVLIATKTHWFQRIWSAAWGAITGAVSATLGWVRNNWPLLLGILTGPVGLAVLWITRHFSTITGFFGSVKGKIAAVAGGMFDGIKDAFRAAINFIIGAWNGLEFKVPGINKGPIHFGGFTVGVPDIPFIAKGGITTGPTLAVIGDNPGGREAVIPLKPGQQGIGGNTFQFTIHAGLGTDGAAVGREIIRAVELATGKPFPRTA